MIKLANFFVSLSFVGYIKLIPPGTFASFLSIVVLFPIVEYKIISLGIFAIVFIVIFLLSWSMWKTFYRARYSEETYSVCSWKSKISLWSVWQTIYRERKSKETYSSEGVTIFI